MSAQLKANLLFLGVLGLIGGAVVWTWLFRQPLGLTEFWYVVGMVVMALGLVALIVGVVRTQLGGRAAPHKRRHRRE